MDADERDPLEELAADYAERLRRGEHPELAPYQRRRPDLAAEIARLFPTIAALEGMREQATPARPPAAAPNRFGEFQVVRELGRGGMGVVYLAEQASLGRRVAVKVLPRHITGDERTRLRFQREARIAAGLSHPNIIPIHAVGEQDGTPWFAMHLVDGVGLDRVVAALAAGAQPNPQGGGLAALARQVQAGGAVGGGAGGHTLAAYREAAALIAQAADALAHAHRRGVLHRDIKPANLILDGDGRLWLGDFGLAKAFGDQDLTHTTAITGTLQYIAPERFDGVTTARSDIYGLGLALCELATWKPAFPAQSRGKLINAILSSGITPPRRSDPHLPASLAAIIERACARDPERRYGDAGALADDLRAFAHDRPLPSARRWRRLTERVDRPSVRMAALIATAALLAGAALSWALLRPGPVFPLLVADDLGAAGGASASAVQPAAEPVPAPAPTPTPVPDTQPREPDFQPRFPPDRLPPPDHLPPWRRPPLGGPLPPHLRPPPGPFPPRDRPPEDR
ncbi:MAG: serine/threonine protein kinase [Planctomycetes bacterium]|nr:serine/threonine protein kinase [Planctomycetota bacterium]